MRDREHPRSSLPLIRSEPVGGLPHLEEDLLQHLLALRAVDEHPEDEAEDARREHVVEPREGILIALGGPHDEPGGVVDGVRAVFGHLHAVDHHIHQHALAVLSGPSHSPGLDHPKVNE